MFRQIMEMFLIEIQHVEMECTTHTTLISYAALSSSFFSTRFDFHSAQAFGVAENGLLFKLQYVQS